MPSEKVLEQKKALVKDLVERLNNSCAGVFVSYEGITVSDDTKLRKELREAGVDYTVIKNTLLLRACEEAGIKGLAPVLNGTTAIATSNEDYVAAARILCDFAENHEFFKTKAGFIDGETVDESKIKDILKTKELRK